MKKLHLSACVALAAFAVAGGALMRWFGDRLNPHEPHGVWLTGYFISPFEATNADYPRFGQPDQPAV